MGWKLALYSSHVLHVIVLQEEQTNEQCGNEDVGPLVLNAFDLIILSQGLNLSALFDRKQVQAPNYHLNLNEF